MRQDTFLSKWIHLKNQSGVSDAQFLKVLDESLLSFGERCLVSYARGYQENPKAILNCFIKYDSFKMSCEHLIKYARVSGILKELEGKKDFSEWVEKQKIEEKWKPVLNKFLIILWGINQ